MADIFRRNGDDHIHYVNGLDIFGETHKNLLPDGLHPNAEGYKIMGSNYAKAFKSIMEGSTA